MRPIPYFTLVDRYFSMQLLRSDFLCLFCLTIIFMLFDMLPKVEEIPELFRQETVLGGVVVIVQYYSVRVMGLLQMVGSDVLVIGAAITFYLMERTGSATIRGGEVFPLLTSGFTRWRVAVPFYYTSIALSLIFCVTEEAFFTFCRDWPGANSTSYLTKEVVEMRGARDPLTDIIIQGKELNVPQGYFMTPKFIIQPELTQTYLDQIMAQKAQWLEESSEHPAGYLLTGTQRLEDLHWLHRPEGGCDASGKRIFYTAENFSWVPEGGIFIISVVSPENLMMKARTFMPESLGELARKLNDPANPHSHATATEFHSRLLRPFLETLVFFITFPIILTARIRSKLLIFFLLLVALLSFKVVGGVCHSLSGSIPGYIAAWLPLFVCLPIATVLFDEFYT
ncbi:MAG: LptF/LptG family permease [Planctomycetia bacterium]|nr:LptF/LptG family permease [Planctomycetia bacterium]